MPPSLSVSCGVPLTVTASLMPTVYVTVLPTPRSPLKGNSAIDDIVGTTVPTGVTETLSNASAMDLVGHRTPGSTYCR